MIPPTTLVVYGEPITQGSKRAIVHNKTGRAVVIESSKRLPSWRQAILDQIATDRPDIDRLPGYPIDEPICARLVFTLPRPTSVRRTWPTAKPDIDKLERAVLDALKVAGVLADDARIVDHCRLAKVYAKANDEDALGRPGVYIDLHAVHQGHELGREIHAGTLFGGPS